MANWRVVHRGQLIEFFGGFGEASSYNAAVFCVSHSTNGSAILPTPLNDSNKNNNAPQSLINNPPENRIRGLIYEIKQVRRYGINYNENNGQWYTRNWGNGFTDKTHDFRIVLNTDPGTTTTGNNTGYGQVYFDTSGTFQGGDFPSGSGYPNNLSPGYAYVITLKTIDASDGQDKMSSLANFIFIVTKNTFDVPDLNDGFK
jgi:hypothetical protein